MGDRARRERSNLAEQLELINAGLCPTCREPIESEREIDGRVVAYPCRHVLRSHP